MKTTASLLISAAFCLSLGACARMPHASQAGACANGFSGTVSWAKAASLLSAAKVQQQFEKYPNCIDKVNRARKRCRPWRVNTKAGSPRQVAHL